MMAIGRTKWWIKEPFIDDPENGNWKAENILLMIWILNSMKDIIAASFAIVKFPRSDEIQ